MPLVDCLAQFSQTDPLMTMNTQAKVHHLSPSYNATMNTLLVGNCSHQDREPNRFEKNSIFALNLHMIST